MASTRPKHQAESPVEVNMDEWDRQLRAESTRLSRQQGVSSNRVYPVNPAVVSHTPTSPAPGADPIENLNQVLGSRVHLRSMKREIAALIMSRAGSHVGSAHALSDEMVDRIVYAVANELSRPPTPDTTGRATIEHELMWSEVREVPPGTETARPHAPVEDVPLVLERDRPALQSLKPVCPQPLKKTVAMPIKLRSAVPTKKTVTRSASSAFSECDSTASYQSLTQSNVSSKTNATQATNRQ